MRRHRLFGLFIILYILTFTDVSAASSSNLCSKVGITSLYGVLGHSTSPICNCARIPYKATCLSDSSETYEAICMDPAKKGISRWETGYWSYTLTSTLDPNTVFGRAVWYAYKDYIDGKFSRDQLQDIVRLLLFADLSGNPGYYRTGKYSSHAEAYYNAAHGKKAITDSTVKAEFEAAKSWASSHSASDVTDTSGTIKLKSLGGNFTDGYKVRLDSNTTWSLNVTSYDYSLLAATYVLYDSSGNVIPGYTSYVTHTGWTRNGSGGWYVIFTIKGLPSSYCSATLKVSGRVDSDFSINNIGIVTADYQKSTRQRYIIVNKSKSNTSKSITIKDTTSTGCTNSCKPSFSWSACDSSATIAEGVETGKSSVNWKTCIIGNTADGEDIDGNSYRISESNEYCDIVCKEDYSYILPGNIDDDVYQGRYISINVNNKYHAITGVAAQRTCISTSYKKGYINTDKNDSGSTTASGSYEYDAAYYKKKAVNALNAYNYYNAMYNALLNYKSSYLADTKVSSSSGYSHYEADKCSCSYTKVSMPSDWKYYYHKQKTGVSFTYTYYTISDTSSNLAIVKSGLSSTIKSGATGNGFSSFPYSGVGSTSYSTTGTINTLADTYSDSASCSCTYTYEYECGTKEEPDTCEGTDTDYGGNSVWSATYGLYASTDEYSKYNSALNAVSNARSSAKTNYESAINTLKNKTKEIQQCTSLSPLLSAYTFDPDINLSYSETDYLEMMSGGNTLVAINKQDSANNSNFLCKNTFDLKNISVSGCSTASTYNQVTAAIPGSVTSPTTYNNQKYSNVREVVYISRYGNPGVTNFSGETGVSKSYIYYRTNSSFYINQNSNKSLVDIGKSSDSNYVLVDVADSALTNSSITTADGSTKKADGYILPIKLTTPPGKKEYSLTYSNIGTYFNSNTKGRIMNNGKSGYLDDISGDTYVCYYTVHQLSEVDCTDEDGCPSGSTSSTSCTGFAVNTYDTGDDNDSDDNGKLEFYAKTVSLNKLFENDEVRTKSFNWVGTTSGYENNGKKQKLSDIISEIQKKGESVYGDTPVFKVTINTKCAEAIRKYNDSKSDSSTSLGLGFSDYTISSTNNKTKESSSFINSLSSMGCNILQAYN